MQQQQQQQQQLSKEQLQIIEEETNKLLDQGVVMTKEVSTELDKILSDSEEIIATELTTDAVFNSQKWGEYKAEISKFAPIVNEYKYAFLLSKQDYKTLRNIFYKEMRYNRNTVFQALVVRDSFFVPIEDGGSVESLFKNTDDQFELPIEISIRDIKRISDLLSMYEPKGLTKETESYASIYKKIGDIMRIFEYYYEKANDLGNRASIWTSAGADLESNKEKEKETTVST